MLHPRFVSLLLGVCLILFTSHTRYVQAADWSPTDCKSKSATTSESATKKTAKQIRSELIPAQKKNSYYFNGNGRVWTQVFKVSKGNCLGCNDPTLFRPLGEGGVNFCWLDQEMRNVAANYWSGKCSPSDIKMDLQKFSTSGFQNQAASFYGQLKTKCGRKMKKIWVVGDTSDNYPGNNVYRYMTDDGMIKWSYGA